MRLTILGTASPIPDPDRAQTGYLLEKSGRFLLIDGGSGVFSQLARLKLDWAKLDTFLLTHLHLDHTSDLLPILTARWLMGSPRACVVGPAGTRQFLAQFLELFPYVRDHVPLEVKELAAGERFSLAGFEIATLALHHHVTSLAYKFDGTLAICGDSEPMTELKEFARGCRVLIHECSFPDDLPAEGHATPTALGEALAGAKIDWLLLTHLYPQAAARREDLARTVRQHFAGRVSVAADLQQLEL